MCPSVSDISCGKGFRTVGVAKCLKYLCRQEIRDTMPTWSSSGNETGGLGKINPRAVYYAEAWSGAH